MKEEKKDEDMEIERYSKILNRKKNASKPNLVCKWQCECYRAAIKFPFILFRQVGYLHFEGDRIWIALDEVVFWYKICFWSFYSALLS